LARIPCFRYNAKSMKSERKFSVVFENGEVIAVNKISGISVSPDRWDESAVRLDRLVLGSLAPENAERSEPCPGRIFTVHRIDRGTSGLVLFAKNETSHRSISLAFEGRTVGKRYIAIVNGRPPWKETACDLPLVPDGNKRHMTIVDKFRGKKSLTRFSLLGSAGNYSVLEAIPETGRTHQIRVHAAALGFPVACDPLYGRDNAVLLSSIKKSWRGNLPEEKPILARLGLHSAELFLPAGTVSGESLALSAPLPRDMNALVKQMEKNGTFLKPVGVEFFLNTETTISQAAI